MTDKWTTYKKYDNIYKFKNSPKIEYVITKEMVHKIKQDILNKKEVSTQDKSIKDKYFRFYKMYNENKAIIAYTNLKMNKMIYNMIKYSLSGKDTYINIFDKYIGVKIRLLDIYKGELNKKIIREIKNDYEIKEPPIKLIKPNQVINKPNQVINKPNQVIQKIDFKEYRNIIRNYYINSEHKKYNIFSIKDTIYGGFYKSINKNDIGFEFNKKDIKIIGNINVKSNLEGLIYIDKYIYDNNINQPYYIYKPNIQNPEKYIFSLVQLDKLKKRINDINYQKIDEYIYGIKIKDTYFFDKSLGKNTIKHNLENIYMTNLDDTKYENIRKLILTIPAEDIKIDIIKIKYYGSDINLDVLLERYNDKYIKPIKKKNTYKYIMLKK